jgi:hypothetical protein
MHINIEQYQVDTLRPFADDPLRFAERRSDTAAEKACKPAEKQAV